MDTLGYFGPDYGDQELWFNHSISAVNFGYPGLSSSSAVAGALRPTAVLSNTNSLDSNAGPDSVVCPNGYGQIPDENTLPTAMDLMGDESFWEALPLLEDPVVSFNLIPELHHHPVENGPGSEGELDVFNPETNFATPDVSRPSTSSRWPNFVRLIRACHRFSHAAAASLRAKIPESNINVFKGVMEKNGKFVCETRVMKKIQLEKKKIIKKVWLGTYQTQAQAARALDVGKYFFNAKETKTFFDPNVATMLSTQSQQLLAQPLEVLVVKVKHLAKHYGIHGTLP